MGALPARALASDPTGPSPATMAAPVPVTDLLRLAPLLATLPACVLPAALDGKAWPDIDQRKQVSGCLAIRDGNTGARHAGA